MLPAIVLKLNENRMQFSLAYTEQDFLNGRFPGFRLEDFHVLLRCGKIAGVLGVWDPTGFRQIRIARYGGLLARYRHISNLFRTSPFPEPGDRVRFLQIAFVSTDDASTYRALLHAAHNDASGRGCPFLLAGLHERDERTRVLRDYTLTPSALRLFSVTFDEDVPLDDRIPHMEVGLL
jgi:hypothetical protein